MANVVSIGFCGPSKTRLGWISLSESARYTSIGINRLLRYPEVPEDVCVITIAHELVHYGHGFGSPLQRCHADPHAGGIVERDLIHRGLARALQAYDHWLGNHWGTHYARYARGRSRTLDRLGPAGTLLDQHQPFPTAALDLPAVATRH